MRKSNYDKYPSTAVSGTAVVGWNNIVDTLSSSFSSEPVWAIDLYVGSYETDFFDAFQKTGRQLVDVRTLMRPENELEELTKRFLTDDVLFGYISNIRLSEYFDKEKIEKLHQRISEGGQYIIIGTGAGYVTSSDVPVVYADLARWEIQQRFRRHEVKALGIDRHKEAPSLQYKRGYFNDWNICDAHKDELFHAGRIRFWLDHNDRKQPKLITHSQLMEGLKQTVARPFRVVPFFDPAPWGGQWMKEVCDLNREEQNYGWCFDCVPEENSLLLQTENATLEFPSQDLVLWQS